MVLSSLDILGWLGAILILIPYFLITHGKVHGKSKLYQLMNLAGSIFIGISAYLHQSYPSVGLNIIWAVIACYGLYHAFFKKSQIKRK